MMITAMMTIISRYSMIVQVSVVLRRTVCGDTREFKKIATAGANTAAGSKFLKK